jgi:hypothetical protein
VKGKTEASPPPLLPCQRQPRRPLEFDEEFEDEFEDRFDDEFDDEFEELFDELLPATYQRSPGAWARSSPPRSWIVIPSTRLGA